MIVKPVELQSKDFEEVLKFLEENEATQLMDLNVGFSRKNVEHAVLETERAFDEGRNVSRDRGIELLIRVTGERQINRAIKKAKIEGKNAVFVCFNGEPEKTWENFKEKFEVKETGFPERNLNEVKERMERTATFWLK